MISPYTMFLRLRPLLSRSSRQYTTVPCYQVDSFSSQPFQGNPAAVCLLTSTSNGKWPLSDQLMKDIAAENNLSETAFIIPTKKNEDWSQATNFHLRWFTPTVEVDLCGHATLATAAVLLQKCGNKNKALRFQTLSGELVASSIGTSMDTDTDTAIEMVLPLNPPIDLDTPADSYQKLSSVILNGNEDLVEKISYSERTKKLVVTLDASKTDRSFLESLTPNSSQLLEINQSDVGDKGTVKGIIVTLKDDTNDFDFISRYFAPWVGIDEDPVTGSAHTVIAPMWSKRFNKNELTARQCSPRGGNVGLRVHVDETSADKGKLFISGEAYVLYWKVVAN